MTVKLIAGFVAASLVLAYVLPPVIKLKDIPLGVVIAIGVILMLIDLYQSLRKND